MSVCVITSWLVVSPGMSTTVPRRLKPRQCWALGGLDWLHC